MAYPDRISSQHTPQAYLNNYHVSEMPALRLQTADSDGVNMALATCPLQIQMRYCAVTGFPACSVWLEKNESVYTAKISLTRLDDTDFAIGTAIGLVSITRRLNVLTDTFHLHQLENAEFIKR